MPNRILREGILTSERVNKLGVQAEVFYRRLMSVVDDYGRYHANATLLRSACYPLAIDRVREADISRLLAEVQEAGLIALYTVNETPFLEMMDTNWQLRAKNSKYPPPDCKNRARRCAQMRAHAPGVEGAVGVEDEGECAITAASPRSCYSPEYEKFWLAVSPHKRKSKADGWKAYQVAVKLLAVRKTDAHGFLLERAAAYYASPLGQTQFCHGPGPFLRQGCYDDDPASWLRNDGKQNFAAGPGQRFDPNANNSVKGGF